MQNSLLNQLESSLEGDLMDNDLIKAIYATDASVYRILPLAVAFPKSIKDIKQLIQCAKQHKLSLIPRTAGTSLAGQCVGEGIVVDVSKYFTKILEFNEKEKTVTVQPGVVRDELNLFLKPYGLFFGPNTSTSNRCMLGGMVGNNSSGSTSIKYGVTRDKVKAMHTVLSDGSEVVFKALSEPEFHDKLKLNTLEGAIYNCIYNELNSKDVQQNIAENFPKPEIHRRNTGYAIDELLKSNVFQNASDNFNMCKLLAGSEGTLAFTTQMTLKLDDLPPPFGIMVAAHFESIENCLNTVALTMTYNLYACEMMDKTILDCTKHNKTQQENRNFIEGDPKAILLCELRANTQDQVTQQAAQLVNAIKATGLSYATPLLMPNEIEKANALRSAGLGLLGNIIGDKKSVPCIEDTAVALPDLANYIAEFTQLMKTFNQEAIYYAHAGAGELHLRPILNIKSSHDVTLFRAITTQVALLVKKYKGSMSGEHGDGIVRSEFIPLMIGESNYQILKRIKQTFDGNNIFNPGKIVDVKPMDANLRYTPDRVEPEIKTLLDFSETQGILRLAEKCNGSGDCRKSVAFGGTMCPSYRATRNEKDTTRARANALREVLTHNPSKNKFNSATLKDVFDLCLSCKACASECPSSVDVASLKAEFLFQYQKTNGVPLRSKLFAYNNKLNRIGGMFPSFSNALLSNKVTGTGFKKMFSIATSRHLPQLAKKSFKKEIQQLHLEVKNPIKTVYLFIDEFTNYYDVAIGLDAFSLLQALHYEVKFINHDESGRAFISKGLLKEAQRIANKNVVLFKDLISETTPLIGIEPSAILTFKDEYIKLASDKTAAVNISKHVFLIEEFIQQEIKRGQIHQNQFTSEAKTVKFHGHCYQKALANQTSSFEVLNLPKNYKVTIIPSGCCGMAGSFGYEQEHFEVSMNIGAQTLFPAIKNAANEVIIAANGTSCRHQIKDGTQRLAKHPISILKEALL